jgi:hypothetical protein
MNLPAACWQIDEQRRDQVLKILSAAGVNLPVEVKTDWYFLGQ